MQNRYYTSYNYDYDFRQNYSGEDFDYSGLNPNNFISGLNENKNNYVLTECDEGCKRCYSIGSNACYECRTGIIQVIIMIMILDKIIQVKILIILV